MLVDRRAAAILLFVCSLPPRAIAAAPGGEAGDAPVVTDEAKVGFQKGVTLYKAGDYAGALAEFQATYKAKPHYSVLYNIAQCHAMLDHNAQALEYYEKYLEEGADYISEDRRDLVLSEIARLKGLLCLLTMEVVPEGAFVLVDGKLIGKTPIAKVQYLDPGEHSIMVQKEGWTTETRTIVLKREKPTVLSIALQIVTSPGKLVVQSKAEGSIVLLDGVEVGTAPWKGDVEAGKHVVGLKGPGKGSAFEEIEVAEGETLKLVLDPAISADPAPEPVGSVAPIPAAAEKKKKAKKIGPGPFAGAAGAAVAGGVVAAVMGALGSKNHDEYLAFRDDVRDGVFTGTDGEAIARQKDYADKGKGLNAGFVAGLTVAAAGAVAAAVLAPFTDWKSKKKVEVQASVQGVLVTVSF